jgi:hypothetical protein
MREMDKFIIGLERQTPDLDLLTYRIHWPKLRVAERFRREFRWGRVERVTTQSRELQP